MSNGLNDKVDANLAEVVKLVNDESERLCREAGRVEGEMKEEMAALRSNLTNVEADVAAKARQDSDGQQRQLGELKMALEEEKMLRGQDNEILKLSLQQGVADLNGQFDEQKRAADKFLEDEREERNSQYDDMIHRVDKEKRERAKAVADLEARLDEDLKRVEGRFDDAEASVKQQVDACKAASAAAAEKAQTDLDELNKVNRFDYSMTYTSHVMTHETHDMCHLKTVFSSLSTTRTVRSATKFC